MTKINIKYLEINTTDIYEAHKPIGGYIGPRGLESSRIDLRVLCLWTSVSMFREWEELVNLVKTSSK